jgi:hypothetical protein
VKQIASRKRLGTKNCCVGTAEPEQVLSQKKNITADKAQVQRQENPRKSSALLGLSTDRRLAPHTKTNETEAL